MKKPVFVPLFMAVIFSVAAQRQRRVAVDADVKVRDLTVVVRDTLGRSIDDVSVSAFSRLDRRSVDLRKNQSGDRFFRVAETDTLDLFVMGGFLEFPVAETDTLLLVISGLPQSEQAIDPADHIDPVSVTGQRDVMIDTGFGMISGTKYSGPGGLLNMAQAKFNHDLISFFEAQGSNRGLFLKRNNGNTSVYIRGANQGRLSDGQLIPALFVVDGIPYDGPLDDISSACPLGQIESILVMRFTPMYGPRGYGGVILITTKNAGNR